MSDPNSFTGADLDRAADGRRRDGDWIASQRNDPGARMISLRDEGLRVQNARLMTQPLEDGPDPGVAERVLLGIDSQGPLWAVDEQPRTDFVGRPSLIGAGGRRGEPAPNAPGWLGLRDAVGTLSQAEGGLAGYAAAMLNWHRAHRFCPNCGAGTHSLEGGLVRGCPRCKAQHHPRTDPVVIMLVTDGERAILGRQASWPLGRYSALAGFVSPGESLEEAVAREVFEEAGIDVGPPTYLSSQPWPFPASLMLGFLVEWTGGEPGGNDPELQDVRWFDRDEVASAAERNAEWDHDAVTGTVQLPPRSAIARRLIEAWLGRT